MAKAFVRQAGEGERYWFYGGGLHVWKAVAEETGNQFFLFEDEMAKGKTTPYHLHPEAYEGVYLLEGEILQHVDGDERVVRAGGFSLVPPGVPHAFLVTADARVLAMQSPAVGQGFYLGASDPATPELEDDAPVDAARVRTSAERNGGVVILGPPPFAQ